MHEYVMFNNLYDNVCGGVRLFLYFYGLFFLECLGIDGYLQLNKESMSAPSVGWGVMLAQTNHLSTFKTIVQAFQEVFSNIKIYGLFWII